MRRKVVTSDATEICGFIVVEPIIRSNVFCVCILYYMLAACLIVCIISLFSLFLSHVFYIIL